MEKNIQYANINKFFKNDKILVWKMDTSHKSILEKFVNENTSSGRKISIICVDDFVKEDKTKNERFNVVISDFYNRELYRTGDIAKSTTRQYLEVLTHYGLIDLKNVEAKNELFNSFLKNSGTFNSFGHSHIETYLEDNFNSILERFNEIIKLGEGNFLYKNLFKILIE